MNKEIFERIVTCRIAFLMKLPFWGNLATRLRLKEVHDDSVTTAATDGSNLFYCADFIRGLTDKQIIFVVGHELLHVVFDHLGRGKDHVRNIFNIAADYAVNSCLVNEGIGSPIGNFISKQDLLNPLRPKVMGTLYDALYNGWTYEQIYEDLIKDKDKIPEFGVSFDFHFTGDGTDGGPVLDEKALQTIQDNMRSSILNAAAACGIGNVPAEIRRMIRELTEPKMDWRQLLTQVIQGQIRGDYTFMKLGRRTFSSSMIFPSMLPDPCVQVTLALDTSGSITRKDIQDFFSEVVGIVEQHANFEIAVMCFDTQAHNYQVFTSDDPYAIFEYEPQGGGGTDFRGVYNYLKSHDIQPKQLVFFTDLEVTHFGDPDYCETLFLVKNSTNPVAPYGTTISYE